MERIGMRGYDDQSGPLFSYIDLEKRIRPDHPLRTIRRGFGAKFGWMQRDNQDDGGPSMRMRGQARFL